MSENRFPGFNPDAFDNALKKAQALSNDDIFKRSATAKDYEKVVDDKDGYWDRTGDSSDPGDPFGYEIKPKNVRVWEKIPVTEEEKAIYNGLHIHTESNPFGLHSHFPGGTLNGGHTHSPSNRFGVHTHADIEDEDGLYSVDGQHTHERGENMPCGPHKHVPENFGSYNI